MKPSRSAARWGVVCFFALASTWNYLDRSVLSAAAPAVRAEFHIGNEAYGWLVSAFSTTYMLASPATGWFLDWLGLERGIAAAVALWSLAALLCGWTRNFAQLLGARGLLGAWESAGVPAAGKLNAIYLAPENRAIGAAMTQVGISIGGIGAPLLVQAMGDWRAAFFVCGGLGLAWVPLWGLVRRSVEPYAVVAPQASGGAASVLREPTLLVLALANMLWMVAYTLWSNWTTLYLTHSFGLSQAQANGYAWFPPLAATLGGFAGGWLSRASMRSGRGVLDARVSAMMVSAVGCLVTVAAPFCPSPFWATVVIAASYFWTTAGSVNLYTIPVDIWGGERAGAAISALVFSYGLLQMAVSPMIGRMVDRAGFTPVCWIVAFPPLIAWLLLRRVAAQRIDLRMRSSASSPQ